MARDQHEAIFTEFYQAATGTARGEGLGLGLAIVSRLCRLLGHEVEVASTPGRGSRFTVSLTEVPPRPEALEAPPEGLDAGNWLRGRLVLVIENDIGVLETTAGLLRGWGCLVVAARSASEAIDSLDESAPDLVIADIHLDRGGDGVEALEFLCKRYGRKLPALFVSGDVTLATRERAANLGLRLLEKPVTPLRLRTLATRLIRASVQPEAETSRSA
jgi:CheY-like chemotaxis protein